MHATAIATSQFADLHIVHAWEAYGEQHVRSGLSPLHFHADEYVAIEERRNRQALKSCLSELRESLDGEELPVFEPVCHLEPLPREEVRPKASSGVVFLLFFCGFREVVMRAADDVGDSARTKEGSSAI